MYLGSDIDTNHRLVTKIIIIFKKVWVRSMERAEEQVEGDRVTDILTYLRLVISIFNCMSDVLILP